MKIAIQEVVGERRKQKGKAVLRRTYAFACLLACKRLLCAQS